MKKLILAAPLLGMLGMSAYADTPDEKDRQAILAMQGEYSVRFKFDETVVLTEGYQRAEGQRSGGDEVVIVLEDSPNKIVLQHLLVDPRNGHVTKHWRQDWEYQAPRRFEFSADQTWVMREIPAEKTQGAWTQCVFEVSDAPRYCGTARWNHRYGVSTWTSDRTWRPLPRREYSKRQDYNAMNVENRHTITPGGWTHEQDNSKAVRRDDGSTERVLVREFGFNDYRKTNEIDFGPAYRYWQATADYWARVRAEWQTRLDAGGVKLDMPLDGMAMIMPLFMQANEIENGKQVGDKKITEVFEKYVKPARDSAQATR